MVRADFDTALRQMRRALQAQAVALLSHTLGSVNPSLLVTLYWQMLDEVTTADPTARDRLYRLAREFCDLRETGKPALCAFDAQSTSEEAVHAA